MTEARGYQRKAALTPEEKLKVAYFYLLRGVAMHVLADMFDVNAGRIAGAINTARAAFKFDGYGPDEEPENPDA
jgi:hypothetical protein